jgi:hypothetical protein
MKDSEDLKVSKHGFIQEIKKMKREEIINSPIEVEKYSLWQRIKKAFGMN